MTRDEVTAELNKLGEVDLQKAIAATQIQQWYKQLWRDHLRDFTFHWAADFAKIVLIMIGLAGFYGLILVGKLIHYNEEFLGILETTHFWISYISVVLLGVMFIGKGVMALGTKRGA